MASTSFIFVCGADEFLVAQEAQNQWAQMIQKVDDDLAREVVDGAVGLVGEVEAAVSAFISAIQTMPMFGDHKCVWLKNASFFGESAVGKTEGAKAQVERLVKALEGVNPQQTSILISAFPVDRRRKEFKWFQTEGTVKLLAGGNEGAEQMLESELAREGIRIRPEAAHALLEKIYYNSRLAAEEARKLATYIGDEKREIDLDLVNQLVPPFGEGDLFEAAEVFFSLDLEQTLAAIRRHFFAGYEIRALLTSLQNRTRILIQLRVLLDAGEFRRGSVNQASIDECARKYARHFGGSTDKSAYNVFSQNPYYLSRLLQVARGIKLRQLIDFQSAFLRAFEESISRPHEEEQIMRETAIRCLG